MKTHCFQSTGCGLKIFIKLTPNARQDEILAISDGVDGPRLAIKVRAITDKGKANKALVDLMARYLGVPKRHIELKQGHKSRLKTLFIIGQSEQLERRLMDLIQQKL